MTFSHNQLTQFGKTLGYPTSDEGMCFGYSCMLALYCLAEEEDFFYEMLGFAEKFFCTGSQPNSTEEAKLFEKMHEFYKGASSFQDPKALIPGTHLGQADYQRVYSLLHPKKLENLELLTPVNKMLLLDKNELEAFFTKLSEIIKVSNSKPILLTSDTHAVFLRYDLEKNTWIYSNTNDFKAQNSYFIEVNAVGLVRQIFHAFETDLSDRVACNIRMWSVQPELLLAERLKELDPYALTKESASRVNNQGLSLIYLASKWREVAPIAELLQYRADPLMKSFPKNFIPKASALENACAYKHQEVVNFLLDDIIKNKPEDWYKVGVLLVELCRINDTTLVLSLLKYPHNDDYLIECFEESIRHTNLIIIDALLKQVQKKTFNDSLSKKLFELIGYQKEALAPLYLLHFMSISSQCNTEILTKTLHLACEQGNLEIVQNLLQLNSDLIFEQDEQGLTLLHTACYSGQYSLVKELLSSHKDLINQKDKFQETPLILAKDYPNIIICLLEHGAEVQHQDDIGRTIFDSLFSSKPRCSEVLNALLNKAKEQGLDPKALMFPKALEKARSWADKYASDWTEYLGEPERNLIILPGFFKQPKEKKPTVTEESRDYCQSPSLLLSID